MKSSQNLTLPVAPPEYKQDSEQTMRRTIEHGINMLRVDMIENREFREVEASLALRRHQFLLMGAGNG